MEQRQNLEAAEQQIERLQAQAQVCRLQADGNCERFTGLIEEQRTLIKDLQKPIVKCGDKPPEEPAETEEPEIVTEETPAGE